MVSAVVRVLDNLNGLRPMTGGTDYSSIDDESGLTNVRVYDPVIYATFTPKKSLKEQYADKRKDVTKTRFSQEKLNELKQALAESGLAMRLNGDPQQGISLDSGVDESSPRRIGNPHSPNMRISMDGTVYVEREPLFKDITYRCILDITTRILFE